MELSNYQTYSLSNLNKEEFRLDPYPFYSRLRAYDPVYWDDELGFWVLTSYADIASVYGDSRFSRAQGLWRGFDRLSKTEQAVATPVYKSFSHTLFYADPPYHTHLRGLVSSKFTPMRVEMLRPYIQARVNELLDTAQDAGGMDAIRDFASPLPVMVIAEMLGLPAADRSQFKEWSDDLFGILGTLKHNPEQMDHAARSLTEMSEYVANLGRSRQDSPRNDLVTALLSVTDLEKSLDRFIPARDEIQAGEMQAANLKTNPQLTHAELVANVNILLSTGHETTTNLIGNGLLALIQNPDQIELLRSNPALIPNAVEEMLRYDNPVQITYRSAIADVEIGDKCIHAGDLVNTILGSANRDPARFTNPDRFDVLRNEGRHLGFGLGIHFCLGAPLVRLEAEIAFHSILHRFRQIRIATAELEWQEHPIFRGLKSLPLEIN